MQIFKVRFFRLLDLTKLLSIGALAALGTVKLWGWPIDVLPDGPYEVASSNFEVVDQIPTNIVDYLKGGFDNGSPVYISSLLKYPNEALSITVNVPDDPSLYEEHAGTQFPIAGYVVYPTAITNTNEDYIFPFIGEGVRTFPKMDKPGDFPKFADGFTRFPLIVRSHGFRSHGLWDLYEMRFLASHGYVVACLFHGDDRLRDSQSQYTLRTLSVHEFITNLITHPKYGHLIDTQRIGISGTSFGGYTGLALLGGKYLNHPSSVNDHRIKAGFATVPWIGSVGNKPFMEDHSGIVGVDDPFMAVIAEHDQIADPQLIMDALQHTSGLTLAFVLKGEGHGLTELGAKEARTLEVLFFDSFLKHSGTTRAILLGETFVFGGLEDHKIIQRIPVEEPEEIPNGG